MTTSDERNTAGNTGFASSGLACLDNIDERALCLYSSLVLIDPARAEFSETRPNAKTENVVRHLHSACTKR